MCSFLKTCVRSWLCWVFVAGFSLAAEGGLFFAEALGLLSAVTSLAAACGSRPHRLQQWAPYLSPVGLVGIWTLSGPGTDPVFQWFGV